MSDLLPNARAVGEVVGGALGTAAVVILGWFGIRWRRASASNGTGGTDLVIDTDPRRYPTRDECLLRHSGVDTRFDALEGRVESLREDLSALSGRVLPAMESLPTVVAAATREEIAKGMGPIRDAVVANVHEAVKEALKGRGR